MRRARRHYLFTANIVSNCNNSTRANLAKVDKNSTLFDYINLHRFQLELIKNQIKVKKNEF